MQAVQVLIAGGGPVGLTLAIVLGRFGIRTMLVERNSTTTRHPKMDITNGRSMELFRKFGLADALRKVAVPESHPFDVAWITSFAGHELHRSATQARRTCAGPSGPPTTARSRASRRCASRRSRSSRL